VTEQELRLSSDVFLARVERLQALELQKRELPASEMAGIAIEVEELAREVLAWARHQTELARDAQNGHWRPIVMIGPRPVSVVLDEWRAAERDLADAEPGTAEWELRRADVDRLSDEYARAYQEQRGA